MCSSRGHCKSAGDVGARLRKCLKLRLVRGRRAPGDFPPLLSTDRPPSVSGSLPKKRLAAACRIHRGVPLAAEPICLAPPKLGAEPFQPAAFEVLVPVAPGPDTNEPNPPYLPKLKPRGDTRRDRSGCLGATRLFWAQLSSRVTTLRTELSDRSVRAPGMHSAHRAGTPVAEIRRRDRRSWPRRIRARSSCSSAGNPPRCLAHKRSLRA